MLVDGLLEPVLRRIPVEAKDRPFLLRRIALRYLMLIGGIIILLIKKTNSVRIVTDGAAMKKLIN